MVEVGVIETPSYEAFIERQHSLYIYTTSGIIMTTKISLKCKNCSADFLYAKKELNRQVKKGRTQDSIFCSLRCARTFKNNNPSEEESRKRAATISRRNLGNSYAKKGEFTYYLKKCRDRVKWETDLDEDYLQTLWDYQKGRCAISGAPIILKSGKSAPSSASLDRVDSSLGYVKGNVQFTAYSINLAKNKFSDDEIKQFLKSIDL